MRTFSLPWERVIHIAKKYNILIQDVVLAEFLFRAILLRQGMVKTIFGVSSPEDLAKKKSKIDLVSLAKEMSKKYDRFIEDKYGKYACSEDFELFLQDYRKGI